MVETTTWGKERFQGRLPIFCSAAFTSRSIRRSGRVWIKSEGKKIRAKQRRRTKNERAHLSHHRHDTDHLRDPWRSSACRWTNWRGIASPIGPNSRSKLWSSLQSAQSAFGLQANARLKQIRSCACTNGRYLKKSGKAIESKANHQRSLSLLAWEQWDAECRNRLPLSPSPAHVRSFARSDKWRSASAQR